MFWICIWGVKFLCMICCCVVFLDFRCVDENVWVESLEMFWKWWVWLIYRFVGKLKLRWGLYIWLVFLDIIMVVFCWLLYF